jgi:CRISPR-associated protein Cas1
MTSLFVDRRDVHMQLEAGALVFRENGERVGTVPLAPITRVFLRGNVTLEASLLGKLGENGAGVVVLSGRLGKPSLMLARPHNDARRRVEQTRLSMDAGFCLKFAVQLIHTKLQRQCEWFEQLRGHHLHARYELSHAIRLLQEQRQKLDGATQLGSLRGMEGSAASIYFAGLRAVVPDSLQFKSRNRRPPRDPFNALLSLTYTLANAEAAMALHAAGFDPCIGFYHQLDFGRESLACDLLETVRPLADRFCLQLVNQQILTKDHFSQSSTGCLLGKAGRAHYYSAYEEYSEPLRRAIQHSVEDLAQTIAVPIPDSSADNDSQYDDDSATGEQYP